MDQVSAMSYRITPSILSIALALAVPQLIGCTAEIVSGGHNGGSADGSGGGSGPSGPGGGSGFGPVVDPEACKTPAPPKAPLRRLTRFEYNNTVRDLAKVTDAPANLFPPEDVGSGFGTDASQQSASIDLVEKYFDTARSMAAALTSAERVSALAPCAAAPAAADEAACARTVIENFVPKAFRRPLEAGEADGLAQLFQTVRAGGSSFQSSLAAVLEATFQAPEFLYRPEFGKPVPNRADVKQPTDHEMASRLSYLFYGSMPDDELWAAASAGQLSTMDGVRAQADRMLKNDKARDVARFFFDSLLPIQALGSLTRTKDYGGFTQEIGHLMRQETQMFLQDQLFNGGTWPTALTAPHTFLNQKLAEYYGITGVTGDQFQKVPLDGVKRAGLLTQAGVVSGPIHSDPNNPVVRGVFILDKLMCIKISTPPASLGPIVPPDPALGGTSRERYTAHSKNDACAGCHKMIDPIGFALENFTSVGQWQEMENGKPIDVRVESPQLGTFSGAVELGQRLAQSPDALACFATNWANFAYGRSTDEQDACTMSQLQNAFQSSGYTIKDLLIALTQTNTFLYMPAVQQ
jgi:hypothetical protein